MVVLPTILEIKRTLDGREKRFDCRLVTGDARHAVLLFVAPAPMRVHGVELPAGTVTLGYFWSDRPYNVYHWLDARAGTTLGFYFNLADHTAIGEGVLEWRDLAIDVLATPDGRLEVLDEDELPADLDPALRARIAGAQREVLGIAGRLMAELARRSRGFFAGLFPEAAAAAPP